VKTLVATDRSLRRPALVPNTAADLKGLPETRDARQTRGMEYEGLFPSRVQLVPSALPAPLWEAR
jgi:hypothetical protein